MKKQLILFAALLGAALAGAEIKVVFFPFREAVIAARVDSVLQPYPFKVGEKFEKNRIICRLDDARYAIELKKSISHYEFAKAAFENKKELRAKNFTSDYELKKAAFDFQIASHALDDAKLNLSYCSIKAPFSGKIVELLTRDHETCRPGQPLLRIIDDNKLLAVANVPVDNRALTRVGNAVRLKIAGSAVVSGVIHEVFPQADHRTGTVKIRILVQNEKGLRTAGVTGVLLYDK
ncbi:MAG: efflux RND transporter periplasmic adaptor subunit [Lentisphaeria bacterium]|nr:efflux RND transporter periplasmic adaptor subunit [Lentisphaeria bacterium]